MVQPDSESLPIGAVPVAIYPYEQRRPGRLVRLPEVLHRTGLSRSTVYRRLEQGAFPKPYPLGGKIVAWAECEIDQWISDRLDRITK